MRLPVAQIISATALALVMSLSAACAFAEDTDDDTAALARALEKQGKKLDAEEKALATQQKKIENERAEFEALKARIEKATGKKLNIAQGTAANPSAPAAAGTAAAAAGSTAVPGEVGTDRKPAAPEKPPEVAKYIEEGGVTLPKGTLVLTPGIEYDHSSAVNVAIEGFSIIPALNIGLFEVNKVDQDILMGSLDARYGVTNRFEIEAKVPYVYADQSTLGQPVGAGGSAQTLSTISGEGIGDVEVAAHYQINNGHDDWPYFIGNLRFKTATGEGPYQVPVNSFGQETQMPTGSGFYAIQPSVTMIYPSDPVVFYSNLAYTHNFARSFATYGDIQPGDSIGASFGMSTSLNDATSLSIGYSHTMVFDTEQNGSVLPGSGYLQVGSVDFGWAYILNDRVSLNLNVSAGVTSDAPDDRVIFRVPITFDLFK